MFVFFQLFFTILVGTGMAQTLEAILTAKETAIGALARAAETAHAFRCTDLSSCSTRCSIPACGNRFPAADGFQCNSNASFGSDFALCGSNCPGLIRSFQKSVVRFPPDASFASADVQAFVCSTHRLEATFQSAHTQGTLKAWQIYGDTSGCSRGYPGSPQGRSTEQCSAYDARIRPWFIAASSGPKDVVIIIDKSGSMTLMSGMYKTRMEVAKDAVSALLGTLTSNDFVSVISFSTTAHVVGGGTSVARATEARVNVLKQEVDNIIPEGTTMYSLAFNAAFAQFPTAGTDSSSGCTRVVLFLTDGDASDIGKESSILPNLETLQGRLPGRAHIFTYVMGANTNGTIPKMIACSNNGVFARINDGVDPLTAMRQYYQFLATGFTSDTVRWTTPYVDYFGLGEMVTGARAVYDRTNPNVPLMVGVIGADVTIAELQAVNPQYQAIVGALISRGASCPNISLTKCQMQLLRNNEAAASVCTNADVVYSTDADIRSQPTVTSCNSQNEVAIVSTCSGGTTSVNSFLCSPVDEITKKYGSETNANLMCCSCGASAADTGVIVGAVIGSVVGVALIAGIVYFVCCRKPIGPAPAAQAVQQVQPAAQPAAQPPQQPQYPPQQPQYPPQQPQYPLYAPQQGGYGQPPPQQGGYQL